jgi:hypothetical protein
VKVQEEKEAKVAVEVLLEEKGAKKKKRNHHRRSMSKEVDHFLHHDK